MGGRGASSSSGGAFGALFKEGDTPKVINPNERYRMEKLTSKGSSEYGNLMGSDVKSILKGYKFNGLFWQKNGSTAIYTVEKPKETI